MGGYTLVWKDILVPSWQPAHLSLEASLTPLPDRPATADRLVMIFAVRTANTSSRRVHTLANIMWLRGIHRVPRPGSTLRGDRPSLRESDLALRGMALRHVERSVSSTTGLLLAVAAWLTTTSSIPAPR